MGELTADERASFGKVKVEEGVSQHLTEENIDWLIDQYESEPLKLLQDSVDRSRDKFSREYSKMQAAADYSNFFTEKGVE